MFGAIDVSMGAPLTVKVTALLIPPAVITATSRGPGAAPGAIVKVAVSDVPLTTVTALPVTPVPEIESVVAPLMKSVPVKVTFAFVPGAPLVGAIEDTVGVGGSIVRSTEIESGEFSASGEVSVIVPLYRPIARPAVLNEAVRGLISVVAEDGDTDSQLPPVGVVTVAVAV